MKLRLEQRRAYFVEWLSNQAMYSQGQTGLGEHLARMVGRDGEIELLEASNDAVYSVNATLNDSDRADLWVKYRAGLIERMKVEGRVECWQMRRLLLAAVERNWMPSGRYVVEVSW
ncbi:MULTISPECIES: hypothetical protein [unclassified Bradyrhizobium]|uniref:hypothetical protein n=1 Tax=unclassified Bradyrhizobium TaxID=2631580 RepID=UPI002915D82D|nr:MULTISPECIES: hypothetical protein [unclassified Bradyrhizobium]